jgi:hypothetical protein
VRLLTQLSNQARLADFATGRSIFGSLAAASRSCSKYCLSYIRQGDIWRGHGHDSIFTTVYEVIELGTEAQKQKREAFFELAKTLPRLQA